jgi:hypothetical protein
MSGVSVELPPVCAPPSGNATVGVFNAAMPRVVEVVPEAATVVVPAAATVVVVPTDATVVAVPTDATVVVVPAAAVVVVAAVAVVVVAATVVVVAAIVVVVVVAGGAAQPTWVIVLLSIATAPLRASALPEIVALLYKLMEARARMVPWKLVLANSSAELPTCQ